MLEVIRAIMNQSQLVELVRLVTNRKALSQSEAQIRINDMCMASFRHTISETTPEEAGLLIVKMKEVYGDAGQTARKD